MAKWFKKEWCRKLHGLPNRKWPCNICAKMWLLYYLQTIIFFLLNCISSLKTLSLNISFVYSWATTQIIYFSHSSLHFAIVFPHKNTWQLNYFLTIRYIKVKDTTSPKWDTLSIKFWDFNLKVSDSNLEMRVMDLLDKEFFLRIVTELKILYWWVEIKSTYLNLIKAKDKKKYLEIKILNSNTIILYTNSFFSWVKKGREYIQLSNVITHTSFG